MKLKTYDRLILLNILPREGDFTTLKIVRQMRENLSFSEDEHKTLQFRQEGGSIHWLTDADVEKNIELGEKAIDIIIDTLKKMDKEKVLRDEHYDLYEKFVGE